MVSMDTATAVKSYQFGERAKSELIIVSQLCGALAGFPANERAGGKRMLIMVMESVRSEIRFAHNATQRGEFAQATNALNEAISLVESDQPDQAVTRVAAAISASTTAAQGAWQVLSGHGLL
jgi:hypothetical protein